MSYVFSLLLFPLHLLSFLFFLSLLSILSLIFLLVRSTLLCAAPLYFRSGDIVEVEINCKQKELIVRNTTRKLSDWQTLGSEEHDYASWRLLISVHEWRVRGRDKEEAGKYEEEKEYGCGYHDHDAFIIRILDSEYKS